MTRIVLDANVLIPGLLSPSNPPGRIADQLRVGQIQLVLNDRIFAEYGNVLRRPKFEPYIRPEEREWILDYIFNSSERIVTKFNFTNLPNPFDAPFLEIAATAQVPLVTGNLKHFPKNKRRKVEVLSPAEYLEQ